MSVHFVYAAAPAMDRASSLAARAIQQLQRGGVPWCGRREVVDTSGWHSRAPFTIPGRLDMAIDSRRFPRVIRRFNSLGRRKFLYLGGAGAQKGTRLLSFLFGLAPAHRCLWIGTGPGVSNIGSRPWMRLEGDALSGLAEECDVFLTMGVSDANPTTILEAMAWGFPVCCTSEAGYAGMQGIVTMSVSDMRHNREMLERIQEAPEEVLLEQADRARRLVESEYTWERFPGTVIGAIEAATQGTGIDPWGT